MVSNASLEIALFFLIKKGEVMLIIILGVVLVLLLEFLLVIHPHLNISFDSSSSFFALILVAAIVLGLFLPVSGYKDWELAEEIELVSLSNGLASGSKGFIYVSLTADNTYTYRYEIDSDFGTTTSKEHKTQTLVNENVEEIEDPNCTTPVIREYSQKAKRSIWTFALGQTNYKYIFYVPEGTISKDVKLN